MPPPGRRRRPRGAGHDRGAPSASSGATTFSALASEPVHTSLFDDADPIPHTRLGQSADLVVVAPATARLLGAYAAGISDDLLTATLLATRAPVVVCPAMHTEMWEHPAVQENLATLRRRGVTWWSPRSAAWPAATSGAGRLADARGHRGRRRAGARPRRTWPACTSLVTAGGTREPIDAVRVITNRSSGKQGYAVAAEAVARGAKVTLVTTVDRPAPAGVEVVAGGDGGRDGRRPCSAAADQADVVVMAAAVADFRPVAAGRPARSRRTPGRPRSSWSRPPTSWPSWAGASGPGQVLVGFAAETDDVVANASGKLRRKHLDLIVANDVSAPGVGFEHDTNAVDHHRTAPACVQDVPLADKRAVAGAVLDAVVRRWPRPRSAGPHHNPQEHT